jgi:hypothetical protein
VIDIPHLASQDSEAPTGTQNATGADPADEAAKQAQEEVQRRLAAGEFDAAIEAFETLPYEEYTKFIGHAVRHLDGNRYYVNLDGELYVYSANSNPQHRHFLRRLDRRST